MGLKCGGRMEVSEQQSLPEQHKPENLGFQSDLSPTPDADNLDLSKLIVTQELENLTLTEENEERELKQTICKELYDLALTGAVNEAFPGQSLIREGEELDHKALWKFIDEVNGKCLGDEEDPEKCREFKDNEVDEKIIGHEEDDVEEKYEIENENDSFGVKDNEFEARSENEGDREYDNGSENVGGDSYVAAQNDGKPRKYHYPLRPDAEDCSYYMRTGMCKFGSNCKFNHPLRRRNQASKDIVKQKEENSDRPGQTECKYYLSSGGCKYGKACKYNHSRGRPAVPVAPVVEFNFLGLPIRMGEKECPYYMRTGSCKYGSNCRFNHPDPTAVGGGDPPAAYGNGESVPLQGPSQTTMSSWSSPRTLNESAPFVPMMYSPSQSIPPPNSEWNGYQAPVYPGTSERSLPTPPAFVINNQPSDTNLYTHHQQHMMVGDFPERPGQPECSYFMKTGDCKYRSACKFHHPKSCIPKTSPSVLSNKGLPLRPDQNICTHYSRYGICKYGPACKYDHPVNYSNSASAAGYGADGPTMAGSGTGWESLIQQPV